MAELRVVDDAERERVREGLTRYKEQHGGIGDPELQQRIMLALGLGKAALPLSTLQRFLRGKHRTGDVAVRRYKNFLEQVAPAHPTQEYVRSFARLFTAGRPNAGQVRYDLRVRPCEPAPGTPLAFELPINGPDVVGYPYKSASKAAFDTAYSSIDIKTKPGTTVFAVSETIRPQAVNPRHAAPIGHDSQQERKGVLMPWNYPDFLIVSSGRFETKLYMLKAVSGVASTFEGVALVSHCVAVSKFEIRGIVWNPAFEIQMSLERSGGGRYKP